MKKTIMLAKNWALQYLKELNKNHNLVHEIFFKTSWTIERVGLGAMIRLFLYDLGDHNSSSKYLHGVWLFLDAIIRLSNNMEVDLFDWMNNIQVSLQYNISQYQLTHHCNNG